MFSSKNCKENKLVDIKNLDKQSIVDQIAHKIACKKVNKVESAMDYVYKAYDSDEETLNNIKKNKYLSPYWKSYLTKEVNQKDVCQRKSAVFVNGYPLSVNAHCKMVKAGSFSNVGKYFDDKFELDISGDKTDFSSFNSYMEKKDAGEKMVNYMHKKKCNRTF